MKHITVTCACGKEVKVDTKIAGQVLAANVKKKRSKADMKKMSAMGVAARQKNRRAKMK